MAVKNQKKKSIQKVCEDAQNVLENIDFSTTHPSIHKKEKQQAQRRKLFSELKKQLENLS